MPSIIWALWPFSVGHNLEAEQYYQESLAIFKEIGDRFGLAKALGGLALVVCSLGGAKRPEAKQLMQQSLTIFRETGQRFEIVGRLYLLGSILNDLEAYQEAQPYCQEAISIAKEVGFTSGIMWAFVFLGEADTGLGDFQAARNHLYKAPETGLDTQEIVNILGTLLHWAGLFAKEANSSRVVEPFSDRLSSKWPDSLRLNKKEWAVEILALVINHPQIHQDYKNKAARLLAQLEGELPSAVVATARERGRVRDVWQTAEELLAELDQAWPGIFLIGPGSDTFQVSPPGPPKGGERSGIPPSGGLGGPLNRSTVIMKILVTGGSGRIGRYVVRDLVEAGHAVLSLDIQPPAERICDTLQVDLTQAGEVYQALARSEAAAVVHLGAWANAGLVVDTRTYGDNVRGTFNLFQACADLGIKRVVSASTNQIYGFAGGPPHYVPVDEAHPLRPVNCYALSKMAGEQAAEYFVANYDMTILSFRFMGVRMPHQIEPEIEAMGQNPTQGARLLWTRTDARDAALACRLAIEAESVPSGPYNITGAQVVLSIPTLDLVKQYFGNQTEIRGELSGHVSPLSCAKAEVALGYKPRFVWSEGQRYPEWWARGADTMAIRLLWRLHSETVSANRTTCEQPRSYLE